MSDFLNELEEDIREEKFLTLWHKYGNFLISVALLIILTTVGYTLWSHFKKQASLRHYASFSQAVSLMNKGKKDEALKLFKTLGKESGGYGKLARLYDATLVSDSEAIYERLLQDNAKDPGFGTLPTLLMAPRALKRPSILSSLQSLSAPNNAWAPLALELLGLAALQKGKLDEAATYYAKALKEPFLTPNEQKRIVLILTQLNVPLSSLETQK